MKKGLIIFAFFILFTSVSAFNFSIWKSVWGFGEGEHATAGKSNVKVTPIQYNSSTLGDRKETRVRVPTVSEQSNKKLNELDANCKELVKSYKFNKELVDNFFEKNSENLGLAKNVDRMDGASIVTLTGDKIKKYVTGSQNINLQSLIEQGNLSGTGVSINNDLANKDLQKILDIMRLFYGIIPDSIKIHINKFAVINNEKTKTLAAVRADSETGHSKSSIYLNYNLFKNKERYENTLREDKNIYLWQIHTLAHEVGHVVLSVGGRAVGGPREVATCSEGEIRDRSNNEQGRTMTFCYPKSQVYGAYASAFCEEHLSGAKQMLRGKYGALTYADDCSEDAAEAFSKFVMYCFRDPDKSDYLKNKDNASRILFFNLFDDMKRYRKDILEQLSRSPLIKQ